MNDYPPLEVKVWGDFACFTRPELKVERVSYPVMTPSAARGVLEAIFWKPEFRWRVRDIAVLRPIRYLSILRNEVNSRVSLKVARDHVAGGGGYFADDDRAQRNSLILCDVAYRIRADVDLVPGIDHDAAKYRDQFRRRVQRGQCWQRPYLGCREFAANFSPVGGADSPIAHDEDIGLMLFDLEYGAGAAFPRFFPAQLRSGVLRVPAELYGQAA